MGTQLANSPAATAPQRARVPPLPEGGGQQLLAKEGEPLLLAQGIGVNLETGQPAIQHGRATLRFCHWRTVLRRQPARTRT